MDITNCASERNEIYIRKHKVKKLINLFHYSFLNTFEGYTFKSNKNGFQL